jgi:hypothetical protein
MSGSHFHKILVEQKLSLQITASDYTFSIFKLFPRVLKVVYDRCSITSGDVSTDETFTKFRVNFNCTYTGIV